MSEGSRFRILRAADVVEEAPSPRGAGSLREIVMGAQDNLTTVLAVVLGGVIGSGEARTVALAGLAAGTALAWR